MFIYIFECCDYKFQKHPELYRIEGSALTVFAENV